MKIVLQAEDGIRDIGVTGVQACASSDLGPTASRSTTACYGSGGTRMGLRSGTPRRRGATSSRGCGSLRGRPGIGGGVLDGRRVGVGKGVGIRARRIIRLLSLNLSGCPST